LRVLGADHRATLGTRSNLAFTLQEAGRSEEALEESGRLLEDRQRVSGNDHSDTIRARFNLAILLGETGKVDEAITLLELLIDEMPQVLGWENLQTLKAFVRLAGLLRDAGGAGRGQRGPDENRRPQNRGSGLDGGRYVSSSAGAGHVGRRHREGRTRPGRRADGRGSPGRRRPGARRRPGRESPADPPSAERPHRCAGVAAVRWLGRPRSGISEPALAVTKLPHEDVSCLVARPQLDSAA